MGPAGRAAAGLGQALAAVTILAGILLRDYWISLTGLFIMIGAQVEDQGVLFQSAVETVRMREVMLELDSRHALTFRHAGRCALSLRALAAGGVSRGRGPELVGIISRQRIVDALRSDGNGYVQAVMSRAFQVARPEDTLGATISRLAGGRGLGLIPVTRAAAWWASVSAQNLMSSWAMLTEAGRIERVGTWQSSK